MTKKTVGVNGIDPARQGFTVTPQIRAIEDSAMILGDRLKLWAIDRIPGRSNSRAIDRNSGEPGECHSPLRDLSFIVQIPL